MKSYPYVLTLLLSSLSALACGCTASTIPPKDFTVSTMWLTKRRILQFAYLHDKLPSNLSSLPVLEGYDNSLLDGWGRPLHYQYDETFKVTLTSFGRDGRAGGTGDDADIIRSFAAKTASGEWAKETEWWLGPDGEPTVPP